jgi:hypothetical protein
MTVNVKLRQELRLILQSNPNSGLSEYYSGVEEFRQGHPAEALRQVENASRFNPRFLSPVERLKSMAHQTLDNEEISEPFAFAL